jgi:LacI family transcriptional regulator
MVNNVGGYSRGVLRGVASFAFARAWERYVWGVNILPAVGVAGVADQDLRALTPTVQVDGWIVQAATPQTVLRLQRAGVPVVNVSSALGRGELPSVVSDDLAVGRLGADYFIRRGFRHFAFYSATERQFARLRYEGFAGRAREAGFSAVEIDAAEPLAAALGTLPRPLAVMGCNDTAALAVLDQCRGLGIKVPDEVAVLGVDNDDLIQSLAFPPLSSINMATERIGFEAAALLERLIQGHAPAADRTLIPPTGVVTRQSSDLVAIADRDVSDAVRFIGEHSGSPIGVRDVLRVVPMSRRQLERRFRATVGRSVLDEIRRCRVDRARQLLGETELTIPQVAMACGFSTASYFTVVFRRATGATPGVYRRQQHARA